jgi:hypothetical protein
MKVNRFECGLGICVLVVGMSQVVYSQTTSNSRDSTGPRLVPPPCNSYTMSVAQKLTFHQKFCYYSENKVLTGSAIFGGLFFSAVAQVRHDPKEWGQGAEGYGRRFGSRYAQGLTKSTAEFLVGAINHEDPRPYPPRDVKEPDTHPQTVGGRLGGALLRTVWTHRDTGGKGIAFSRVAGAFASGFVGNAWYPDRLATTQEAFKRTGSAFGGYVMNSLFSEFQADVFRLFRKMMGLAPKKPPQMKH